MDPSESNTNELLFFGNNSASEFDATILLSEPIADERDMTTRSADTFDSFGDFADDIDIDLSDDELSLQHHESISGSGFAAVESSPAGSPSALQKPTMIASSALSHSSFLSSTAASSISHQATVASTNNATMDNGMRQIPARAASYSEGDQQSLLLQIQQMSLLQMQQQQQQLVLQNSLSSLQTGSFHENAAANTTAATTTNTGELFSQQQQAPPNLQGLPSSSQHSLPQGPLNDAMEKLCETMKRSAVTRNLVKQLSGVTRSNSGVGLMRTNPGAALKRTSSGKGSLGEMARMAPIRRPSNSKHSIKRGVLPQSSQHSLDGSNHLLQVDGRTIAHFKKEMITCVILIQRVFRCVQLFSIQSVFVPRPIARK